jgi:xanthine dehydrogenase small subunit
VVSLAGFCLSNKEATKENAIAAVDGNICRCTGYKSIERAAAKVAESMKERNGEDTSLFVAKNKILPNYFSSIKSRLQNLFNGQSPLATYHLPLTVVSGGTDLYVQKHDEIVHAPLDLVFDKPELKGIIKEGNKCIIGASVTVTDMMESEIIKEHFPGFSRYAKLISSTPIRNMATIAGNFINASPIGDFTIFFLALNADLELHNSSNGQHNRIMPLRKLYKGYKQLDKHPDEIVTRIIFELPATNSYFNFEKVSKRTNLDIASVNTAIHLRINNDVIEDAGVSAGGVAPVPLYLEKTSDFLKGKTITEKVVDETIAMMQTEISPISDARGTKEYKRLLLGQLLKAHLKPLTEGNIY